MASHLFPPLHLAIYTLRPLLIPATPSRRRMGEGKGIVIDCNLVMNHMPAADNPHYITATRASPSTCCIDYVETPWTIQRRV